MSWQNKYRPTKIADLHLTRVREQMERFLAAGKLPQVLLFAGPKGTGKTTTARIIAAILNSANNAAATKAAYALDTVGAEKAEAAKPETATFTDPDLSDDQIKKIISGQSYFVQEIDAASNRRIEDVRALQERIFLPPSGGQMAVYILDEVHMFTTEAFNALLKLLEEPPEHCVFILATTEKHKIPATIVSRCSVIEFQQASVVELVATFERVLVAEGLTADQEALAQIALLADGSFRDGIKLLEMAAVGAVNKKITLAAVQQTLQSSNFTTQFQELLALMFKKPDVAGVQQFFGRLRQSGVNETFFNKAWLNFIYQQLEIGLTNSDKTAALLSPKVAHSLLTQMNDVDWAAAQLLPFLNFELKCLDLTWRVIEKAKRKV
jgi:DNA polymerase-3 subunit gamma/tau